MKVKVSKTADFQKSGTADKLRLFREMEFFYYIGDSCASKMRRVKLGRILEDKEISLLI